MNEERWRDIQGLVGYQVSDHGRVRSRRVRSQRGRLREDWQIMKTGPDGQGYPRVGLRQDDRARARSVHHLVLEAFVGPRPSGMECCHGERGRSDNHLDNLRWDTRQNNVLDREATARGNGRRKLQPDDVREVRALLAAGVSTRVIGERFGVSQSHVCRIKAGKQWKFLVS